MIRLLVLGLVVALVSACGASTNTTPPTSPATVTPDETVSEPPASLPTEPASETPLPAPTTLPIATPSPPAPAAEAPLEPLLTGAERLALTDFQVLQGKRVGIIVNQTSVLADGTHLIDALNDQPSVELVVIFAPEHGVRGTADAGALVDDTQDPATGIPIRSLYGTERTPAAAALADLDVLIYDLQDVGTRFYTFISTLGLAMAAADQADVEFMVLDRPNPLGGELVSGFERTDDQASFISQYPIPAVYGMTAGELALMIAGEGWIGNRQLSEPTIVTLSGWDRSVWPETRDWIAPSPGLPTIESARIYPGTVFVEATTLSYGKGTPFPFSIAGSPQLDAASVADELRSRALPGIEITTITATPSAAVAPNPRFEDLEISAIQLTVTDPTLYQPVATGVHLLTALRDQLGSTAFIDRAPTFDLLAGTTQLRIMLDDGATATQIIAAWEQESATFALRRQPYLLYPGVSPD